MFVESDQGLIAVTEIVSLERERFSPDGNVHQWRAKTKTMGHVDLDQEIGEQLLDLGMVIPARAGEYAFVVVRPYKWNGERAIAQTIPVVGWCVSIYGEQSHPRTFPLLPGVYASEADYIAIPCPDGSVLQIMPGFHERHVDLNSMLDDISVNWKLQAEEEEKYRVAKQVAREADPK